MQKRVPNILEKDSSELISPFYLNHEIRCEYNKTGSTSGYQHKNKKPKCKILQKQLRFVVILFLDLFSYEFSLEDHKGLQTISESGTEAEPYPRCENSINYSQNVS